MNALLAMVVLLGGECVWWSEPADVDDIIVECDLGSGWSVCGHTPTFVDSGPFGVSAIHYMPLLKLDVDPPLGQTISVRIRSSNSYGESPPSAPVDVVWPEIWDPLLVPECGDGVATGVEICDGDDFGAESCRSQGFDYGQLTCNDSCDAFDTADCRYSRCGNGICEIVAGEDCLSCSVDCNGVQHGRFGDRYCCGDGEGQHPIRCDDFRCTLNGSSCVD